MNLYLNRITCIFSSILLSVIVLLCSCQNLGPVFYPTTVIVPPPNSYVQSYNGTAQFGLFTQDPLHLWTLMKTETKDIHRIVSEYSLQSWNLSDGIPDLRIALNERTFFKDGLDSQVSFAKTRTRAVVSSADYSSNIIQLAVIDLSSGYVSATTSFQGGDLFLKRTNVYLEMSPDGSQVFIFLQELDLCRFSVYLWQFRSGIQRIPLSFPYGMTSSNCADPSLYFYKGNAYPARVNQLFSTGAVQAFSQDSNRIVIDHSRGNYGGDDFSDDIGVWDLSTNSWVFQKSFPAKAGDSRLIYFRLSHQGTKLITVHQVSPGSVVEYQCWDLVTGALKWSYQKDQLKSNIVDFSADDTQVLVPDLEQGPVLLNTEDGTVMRSFEQLSSGIMSNVSASPDGSKFVGYFTIGSGQLWDAKDGNVLARLNPPTGLTEAHIFEGEAPPVLCVDHQFTPDGTYVVARGINATQSFICVFDLSGL